MNYYCCVKMKKKYIYVKFNKNEYFMINSCNERGWGG